MAQDASSGYAAPEAGCIEALRSLREEGGGRWRREEEGRLYVSVVKGPPVSSGQCGKRNAKESGSRRGRDRDDGRGTTKTEKNNVARSVPRDIQKIRRENWEEGGGAAAPRMMRNERRPSPGPLDGRPVASTRANLKAITGVLGSFVNGGVRINCKSSGSLSRTPTRSYSLRYHYFLVLLLTCRFNNTGATVFRAGRCVTAMEAAMILHDLSFVQGK